MKAIISHDIDLLKSWEHKKDLIIPKFIVRSCIELAAGSISSSEYLLRFRELVRNKLHNLEELMEFNKVEGVPSTFFVGVNNGLGLSYSLAEAKYWTRRIMDKGFDVGVHGIEFNDFTAIEVEYETFRQISGSSGFGVRMHYLRNSENTVRFLSQAGYLFDSSLYITRGPFLVGGLWEFPLHIMDSHLFERNSHWQNQTFQQAKDRTKERIEEISNRGIEYLTVLFHDRYFSKSFKSRKDWYIWIIDYLQNKGLELTTYKAAIQDLDAKHGINGNREEI